MFKSIRILFFLLAVSQLVQAQEQDQILLGSKHQLHSQVLEEDRVYWLSLPESYSSQEASHKSYPVLILLDGNLHFKPIAGMVHYLSSDRYGSRKIPEMIVVGIQNVDRRRDYTPDKVITVRENNTGGGERFLRFLEEELIPELDQQYRTEPYRILYGHSLGGLLATHAYMKEHSLFNAFLAVDPSLGTWDAATMDQKLDAVTDATFKRFFYLATANWGKRNFTNRDRHVRLYEGLNRKYEGDFPAQLTYFENENHASVPPIAFHEGISAIFEGYGISYRDVKTQAQLLEHFQSISQRLSWEIHPPETLVNQLGYNFLRSRDEQERSSALDFFLLNTVNFPDSFNAFDSLGEAYEALGDPEKARENYKKSLELNPQNQNAKNRLEALQGEQ
ncbi:alpha/beta hydrolase-fold protein [Algoriphagus sp. CAU 1675]|uniref:alpha/beta hydrolase-fold protein n=1 Tax=Algoriphagus sp. CAU 1675 TaxID=3032597 RepID=UPI0023D9BDF6|nr:alpha/beta hydrolase-fold protein [Algoriphagus sp. CAU 1675]MDF2158333.1 alpha/beta hydrolase-fold protein [Algoriphagus sp. CAU 1675]